MITQATIDKLHSLKLKGMATAFVEQLESPLYRDLSFAERFGLLVDREAGFRENRKVTNLLKSARFRHPSACLEDIDFRATRGLAKEVIVSLSLNDWIRKKHNIPSFFLFIYNIYFHKFLPFLIAAVNNYVFL